MGKFSTIKITSLFIIICISALNAQTDDLIVESNSGGLVSYTTTSTDEGTLFFTLFGDGYYSQAENPKHLFVQDNDGFNTTTYFVKPYKPNSPPKMTVATGSTGAGAAYTNPEVEFSEKTKVFTSWSPSFRNQHFFILAFQNNFSSNDIDGCVEFHFHKRRSRINGNNILEHNNWVFNRTSTGSSFQGLNKSFIWEFDKLAFGETRYVYIPALNVVKAPNAYTINTVMRPGCSDQVFSESTEFRSELFPHDPNAKRPQPPCLPLGQDVHEITYTISFFNDGETYATDVSIKDALSSQFDLSTFQFLDSEYPANATLNGNVLQIDLPGIKLPGTNQEIPNAYTLDECTSWIKFKIKTNPLSPGECIDNIAGIYFDNLPPVITPTATVCYSEACNPRDKNVQGIIFDNKVDATIANVTAELSPLESNDESFSVFPNPIDEVYTINFNQKNLSQKGLKITLLDSSGKTIKILYDNDDFTGLFKDSYKLSNVHSGLYLLKLETADGIQVKRIFKM